MASTVKSGIRRQTRQNSTANKTMVASRQQSIKRYHDSPTCSRSDNGTRTASSSKTAKTQPTTTKRWWMAEKQLEQKTESDSFFFLFIFCHTSECDIILYSFYSLFFYSFVTLQNVTLFFIHFVLFWVTLLKCDLFSILFVFIFSFYTSHTRKV